MRWLLWQVRKWLVQRPFLVKARRRRYDDFVALVGLQPEYRILDAGSGGGAVSGTLGRFNPTNPIVALDLISRDTPEAVNVTFVQGDATAMPFADHEFDVAFCNSLIEHLTPDGQDALAREIRRVAASYWVQTPNRHFPIEPHQLIPGYQFLPRAVRRPLDRRLTGGGYTELLTRSQLQALFPEAQIYEERACGTVKSFAAYQKRQAS
jgi:SAM-dependent methyltransferase